MGNAPRPKSNQNHWLFSIFPVQTRWKTRNCLKNPLKVWWKPIQKLKKTFWEKCWKCMTAGVLFMIYLQMDFLLRFQTKRNEKPYLSNSVEKKWNSVQSIWAGSTKIFSCSMQESDAIQDWTKGRRNYKVNQGEWSKHTNITKRNKGKHDTKDITEEGYRKRAKIISYILDHTIRR